MPASQKPSGSSAKSPSVEEIEGLDPADPHPPEEGDPYNTRHPDGWHPHPKDIGPNLAVHNGTAPGRPDNATTKARS